MKIIFGYFYRFIDIYHKFTGNYNLDIVYLKLKKFSKIVFFVSLGDIIMDNIKKYTKINNFHQK